MNDLNDSWKAFYERWQAFANWQKISLTSKYSTPSPVTANPERRADWKHPVPLWVMESMEVSWGL